MEKKILILDLDQTIISAEVLEEFNEVKHKDKIPKFDHVNLDGYYIIFQRPNLQEFLDFAFQNFKVMVWTAATKDYGLFVIKSFITNKEGRELELILFDYHCDISEKLHKSPKKLSILSENFRLAGYEPTNIFIIDDYDEVYKPQVENCIMVKPFYFEDENSENDDYLLKLKDKLQKALSENKSVQTFVKEINEEKN